MKVRELVAILMELDHDSDIAIWDDEQYCAVAVDGVDQVKETYMNGFGGVLINATKEIRNEQA